MKPLLIPRPSSRYCKCFHLKITLIFDILSVMVANLYRKQQCWHKFEYGKKEEKKLIMSIPLSLREGKTGFSAYHYSSEKRALTFLPHVHFNFAFSCHKVDILAESLGIRDICFIWMDAAIRAILQFSVLHIHILNWKDQTQMIKLSSDIKFMFIK